MPDDDTPTSFDALAHEHNLSDRMRDALRVPFREGLARGRGQRARTVEEIAAEMNLSGKALDLAREFAQAAELIGRRRVEAARRRGYHHVTDRDTAPGEFR